MKLAVTGKEDVEVLEKMVRERFEKVPVTSDGAPAVGVEGVRIAFDESPMGPEQMGVSLSLRFRESREDANGVGDYIC